MVSVRYRKSNAEERLSVLRLSERIQANAEFTSIATTLIRSLNKFAATTVKINASKNATRGTKIRLRSNGIKCITKPLASLHNRFRESCYLLASGPSISQVDFSLLQDQTLVAMNGAAHLLSQFPIKFSLYIVVDPYFASYRFSLLRDAIKSGAHCLFTEEVLYVICALGPELLKGSNIYLIQNADEFGKNLRLDEEFFFPDTGNCEEFGFSKNIGKGVVRVGTVAYNALQVCRYAGFNIVYALGLDFNYETDKYRFYDNEDDLSLVSIHCENLDKTFEQDILPAFQTLNQMTKNDRFCVYNLSKNSRLPDAVVSKITLEQSLTQYRTQR